MNSVAGILTGRRILVVEDEAVVSMVLDQILSEHGAVVVGPVWSAAAALALIEQRPVDCAVLDIQLQDGTSVPVAEALAARGVPFLIITGYADVPTQYKGARILRKVFMHHELIDALVGVIRP